MRMNLMVAFETAGTTIVLAALVLIAKTDLDKRIVPNRILMVLILVRVGLLLPEMIVTKNVFGTMGDLLIGTISIFLPLLICSKLLVRIFRTRGLGMGDVKLLAVLGMYFQFDTMLTILIISLVLSLVVGTILVINRKMKMKESFSFAPFIAAGTFLTVLGGYLL